MKKVVLIASMLTVCNLFGPVSGQFTYIKEGFTYTEMNKKQAKRLKKEILDAEGVTMNEVFDGPLRKYFVYTYNKGTRGVTAEKSGPLHAFVYYNYTDKKAFYSSDRDLFGGLVNALEYNIGQNRKREKKKGGLEVYVKKQFDSPSDEIFLKKW